MEAKTVLSLNKGNARLAIDTARARELAIELDQHRVAAERARKRMGKADPFEFRSEMLALAKARG